MYLLQDLLLGLSGISEPGAHREDAGGRRCRGNLIAAKNETRVNQVKSNLQQLSCNEKCVKT